MLQGSAAQLPAVGRGHGVGARLWICTASQGSAGQGLMGRVISRLDPLTSPLGASSLDPDSLPAALPWSSKLHSEAGSWVSKAAESLQPTQTRPEGAGVSIIESVCFPHMHLRLAPKKKNHLLIWGPRELPLSYCCSLPEVDLCSPQTLNLSVPWSLIGLLRFK